MVEWPIRNKQDLRIFGVGFSKPRTGGSFSGYNRVAYIVSSLGYSTGVSPSAFLDQSGVVDGWVGTCVMVANWACVTKEWFICYLWN